MASLPDGMPVRTCSSERSARFGRRSLQVVTGKTGPRDPPNPGIACTERCEVWEPEGFEDAFEVRVYSDVAGYG